MNTLPETMIGLVRHPMARIAIVIALLGVAGAVLWRELSVIDWALVGASLLAYPPSAIALALSAAAMSYGALAAYEVVAVSAAAPGRMSPRRAALSGAAANAVTNLTGHAYIVGVAVRARLYARQGVDVPHAIAITAIAGLGFWLGLGLVLGCLLVLHPEGVFAQLGWSRALDAAVGLAVLGVVAMAFVLAGSGRTVTLWRWTLNLPSPKHLLGLMLAGGFDLLGVSLTLYILMPPDAAGGFAAFFATFAAALGLGIVSATPAGIGVFEATLLVGLGIANRPDVVAALAAYRVIYFIVPFILAGPGLAIAALMARKA